MASYPTTPLPARPTPLASTLNRGFRWALITSAAFFAASTSVVLMLSFEPALALYWLIIWVSILSFIALFPCTLGVVITEILRAKPQTSQGTQNSAPRPAPGIWLPLVFTALGLVLALYYGLHVFLWNPLATAPGYSLSEIYRTLQANHEFSFTTVIIWGVIALLPLAALPNVHEWLRGMASYTILRALGFCALTVSVASFLLFLGWGWHMGMGLADTFMTTGDEHSPTAIPFGVAILALGAVGIYGLFVPVRTR